MMFSILLNFSIVFVFKIFTFVPSGSVDIIQACLLAVACIYFKY